MSEKILSRQVRWQRAQKQAGRCITHSDRPVAPGYTSQCKLCVARAKARSKRNLPTVWERLHQMERTTITRKNLVELKDALIEHNLIITLDGLEKEMNQ